MGACGSPVLHLLGALRSAPSARRPPLGALRSAPSARRPPMIGASFPYMLRKTGAERKNGGWDQPTGRRLASRLALAPALAVLGRLGPALGAGLGAGLRALGGQGHVALSRGERVPAAPGHRGVPGRVARGDQQATEHGDVLQEVNALLRALLLVIGLPEPVPGVRGRQQARRDGQRRHPREAAQGQHRAGHQLDRAVDPDRLLNIVRHEGRPLGERPDHRFRGRHLLVRMQHGVQTLDDEDRRQHGTRDSSQHSHDARMPVCRGF